MATFSDLSRDGAAKGRSTTRRALLRGAALGGAGLALGGLRIDKALADSSESLATIINIALTAEYLAVTTYSNALANFGALGLDDGMGVNRGYLVGALAAESDHVAILQLLGGQALATSFSYPAGTKMFSDGPTFAATLEALETAFVAAYMAAVAEAAAAGRPDVAQLASRHMAVEAEHRVNARNLVNKIPSNNSSFEARLFNTVGDAATALTNLGFLSPSGTNSFSYPGPVAPSFANMVDRHP